MFPFSWEYAGALNKVLLSKLKYSYLLYIIDCICVIFVSLLVGAWYYHGEIFIFPPIMIINLPLETLFV